MAVDEDSYFIRSGDSSAHPEDCLDSRGVVSHGLRAVGGRGEGARLFHRTARFPLGAAPLRHINFSSGSSPAAHTVRVFPPGGTQSGE